MPKFLLITITIFCITSTEIFAQRPKIGLTLAGGGAKGLAHIGILKALDSAQLKVDYVTGTSMGAIVGGLYAAGYSGDTIEKLAKNLNWRTLLSNSTTMRNLIVEEKSEFGKYAIELPLKKRKLRIPTGLIESEELWLKLSELFYPVLHVKDFNQLSIPFLCVATNIETGEPVALRNGNIVTAIRASMAIPGVFSSVKIGDNHYVDGAMARNYPVINAQEMGANYKIGVYFGSPKKSVEELNGMLDIMYQLTSTKENIDFNNELKIADLNVKIDLPTNLGSSSFASSQAIIDIGNEIGKLYYPTFKKLADSLDVIYGKTEFKKDRLPENKCFLVNKIELNGLTPLMKHTEHEKFKPHQFYDYQTLTRIIRDDFGTRLYTHIKYDIVPDTANLSKLTIDYKLQPFNAVKAAVNYNNETGFNLVGNITLRNWLTPYSRHILTIGVGDTPQIFAENLIKIPKLKLSYQLQVNGEASNINTYTSFIPTGSYRYRYFNVTNQFLIANKRKYTGGFGIRWEDINLKPLVYAGDYFQGNNTFFNAYTTFIYNSFEKPFFPYRGWKINVELGYNFGLNIDYSSYSDQKQIQKIREYNLVNNNYVRYIHDISSVIPIAPRLSGVFRSQAMINFGRSNSLLNQALVGGNNSLIHNQIVFEGLNRGSINSQSITTLQAGARMAFGKAFFATIRANSMIYDFIPKDNSSQKYQFVTGVGATLSYNMLIGPMEWTVGYNKSGGFVSNIRMGFPFK